MADGSLNFNTKIDSSGFQKGLSGLKSIADKGLGGIKSIVTGIATSMAAATAGLAAASCAAIKAGIDFESAFTGVRKTVDATEEQLSSLETAIRGMSKSMPQSAAEIAGIAEAAGQLGIAVDNIEGFTKTMAQLGDATNLTSEDAASNLAKFANITGMSQTEFDRLGSTIVDLGNNSATTEADIVSMGMRLAGTGKQIGMTESEIMGFSAALSSVGIEAEAGGTAFSTLFSKMTLSVEKGGEGLKNFASVAGMSTDEFAKAFKTNASGAVTAFLNGLSSCEKRGQSAIGVLDSMGISEIRLRDSLLRASSASELFAGSIELANNAWKENTALAKEAETRYATMESQLGVLKNKLTDIGISFYQDVRNPMTEVVKSANDMLDSLSNAFNEGGLSGLVAEIGNCFSEMAVGISEAMPSIIDAGTDVVNSFVEGLDKNVDKLIDSGEKVLASFVDGVTKTLSKLGELAGKIINRLSDDISKHSDDMVKVAGDTLGKFAKGIISSIPKLVTSATSVIKSFSQYLRDKKDDIASSGADLIKNLSEGIRELLPALAELAKEIASVIADTILATDWIGVGKDIIAGISKGLLELDPLGVTTGQGADLTKEQIDEDKFLAWYKDYAEEYGQITELMAENFERIFGVSYEDYLKNNTTSEDTPKYDVSNEAPDVVKQAPLGYSKDDIASEIDDINDAIDEGYSETADIVEEDGKKVAETQNNLIKRMSESALKLLVEQHKEEEAELQKNLEEKTRIGIGSIQEQYNKKYRKEKAAIESYNAKILDVQNKAQANNTLMSNLKALKSVDEKWDNITKAELQEILNMSEDTQQLRVDELMGNEAELTALEIQAIVDRNKQMLELEEDNLKNEQKLQETIFKSYTDTYNSMVSEYEKAYNTITNKQESLANKLKSFGDLFEKVSLTINEQGDKEDFMKLGNLEEDVQQLKLLSEGIEKLREKGVSQSFLDNYLSSQSVEDSLDYTELLLTQSQDTLDKYLAAWEEKNKIAEELSKSFYQSEYEKIKIEFTDKVNGELGLMPDEAKQVGQNTAKSLAEGVIGGVEFVKGAVGELVEQMKATVNAELAKTGIGLSANSTVTQNVQTKDTSVLGALGSIYNVLLEEAGAPIIVELDGKKVGEGSADGTIRELKRRGVVLNGID